MTRLMAAAFVTTWSSGFVGATLAGRTGATTWPLLAWRYLATAALLALACALTPSARAALQTLTRREVARQGIVGLLAHATFLGGAFLAAERGLPAGTSAVVCALQPLLVAAAGAAWFGDRLHPRQWLGLLVALGGVVWCVGGSRGGTPSDLALVVTSLLSLCAASLLERRWGQRTPLLPALTIQVACAATAFVVIAVAGPGLSMPVTAATLAALAWLVLLSGLGGYAAFTWCLHHLGATRTSTLLYLTAPMTMAWGLVMFGQRPTAAGWWGLGVVLTGVALATRTQPAGT